MSKNHPDARTFEFSIQRAIFGRTLSARASPRLILAGASLLACWRRRRQIRFNWSWTASVLTRLAIGPAPSAFHAEQMQETSQAETERQLWLTGYSSQQYSQLFTTRRAHDIWVMIWQRKRHATSGWIISTFRRASAASAGDAWQLTQARAESRPRAARLRGPGLSHAAIRASSAA